MAAERVAHRLLDGLLAVGTAACLLLTVAFGTAVWAGWRGLIVIPDELELWGMLLLVVMGSSLWPTALFFEGRKRTTKEESR